MRHQVERLKHAALKRGIKPARALTATLVAVGMMATAAISFVLPPPPPVPMRIQASPMAAFAHLRPLIWGTIQVNPRSIPVWPLMLAAICTWAPTQETIPN